MGVDNCSNDTHDWVGNIDIYIFWDIVLCEYENREKKIVEMFFSE